MKKPTKIQRILLKIPKGKVMTYKELAKKIKTSPRAVGHILKRNPCPQTYPCYKVIRSDGRIGGYLGKKNSRKVLLLKKDGIVIINGRIDLSRFGYKFKNK